jgi:hypothetical protein
MEISVKDAEIALNDPDVIPPKLIGFRSIDQRKPDATYLAKPMARSGTWP